MAEKAKSTSHPTALQFIRTLYLSVAAGIGLVCFIIGASGAVKLVMNVWFPVNNYIYYSPYEKPCDQPIYGVDGKVTDQKRTPAEIADCEKRVEENNQLSQRNEFNREISQSVALTVVGLPVWLLHFWFIQQDWKRRKDK